MPTGQPRRAASFYLEHCDQTTASFAKRKKIFSWQILQCKFFEFCSEIKCPKIVIFRRICRAFRFKKIPYFSLRTGPTGLQRKIRNLPRPCSSTLGQVGQVDWTDPLSLSHLSHEDLKTPFSLSHLSHVDLKTPFSLSHLSHVLQLVPNCPIWLYYLSFANSVFSDFFLGFS